MSNIKNIKVLFSNDGLNMYEGICNAFNGISNIVIDCDISKVPGPFENIVIICLLTDQVIKDTGIADYLGNLEQIGFPIIPVVNDISSYDFTLLPPSFSSIKGFNAVGWNDGTSSGDELYKAIKGYLGILPFNKYCKVFISYRRTDGRDIALKLYDYLYDKHYQVFLDTEDIEPGERVQKRIHDEITDLDLIVLVDTPDAVNSEWVMEEISSALASRVTVCSIRLPQSEGFPLSRDMQSILWNEQDPNMMHEAFSFIKKVIASKTGFDMRVDRTLSAVSLLNDFKMIQGDNRQRIFFKKINGKRRYVVVEYENSNITLERLYQLYLNYIDRRPKSQKAFLIHKGLPLSKYEQKAVRWARGKSEIYAIALSEINDAISTALS